MGALIKTSLPLVKDSIQAGGTRLYEYMKKLINELQTFQNATIYEWNRFQNLPVYADNTAAKAAGMANGDLYRTSTGVVMVVYT